MFVIACSSTIHHESTTNKVYLKDSLLASIERSACFGKCPQYKTIIYKSGFAEYYGKKDIDKIGYYTGQLNADDLNRLYSLIRTYKMEEKDTAYINKYLADFPAWSLWVSDLNPTKHIQISHEAPPSEITEFGKAMDQYLVSVKWTKKTSTKDEK